MYTIVVHDKYNDGFIWIGDFEGFEIAMWEAKELSKKVQENNFKIDGGVVIDQIEIRDNYYDERKETVLWIDEDVNFNMFD